MIDLHIKSKYNNKSKLLELKQLSESTCRKITKKFLTSNIEIVILEDVSKKTKQLIYTFRGCGGIGRRARLRA